MQIGGKRTELCGTVTGDEMGTKPPLRHLMTVGALFVVA